MSRIKKGDFVIGKRERSSAWLKKPSEVMSVFNARVGAVAIVKFEDTLVKILVEDLVKAEESISITKSEYLRLTDQVIQRENFDISDSSYEILSATAPLLFKRLELLLFGEAEND